MTAIDVMSLVIQLVIAIAVMILTSCAGSAEGKSGEDCPVIYDEGDVNFPVVIELLCNILV